MSLDFGLEVAEARPIEPIAKVNFGHNDRAPFFRLSDHATLAVVNTGDHPIERCIGIATARNIDVVLARPRRGEPGIAPGYRERDDLCAPKLSRRATSGKKPS